MAGGHRHSRARRRAAHRGARRHRRWRQRHAAPSVPFTVDRVAPVLSDIAATRDERRARPGHGQGHGCDGGDGRTDDVRRRHRRRRSVRRAGRAARRARRRPRVERGRPFDPAAVAGCGRHVERVAPGLDRGCPHAARGRVRARARRRGPHAEPCARRVPRRSSAGMASRCGPAAVLPTSKTRRRSATEHWPSHCGSGRAVSPGRCACSSCSTRAAGPWPLSKYGAGRSARVGAGESCRSERSGCTLRFRRGSATLVVNGRSGPGDRRPGAVDRIRLGAVRGGRRVLAIDRFRALRT